MQMLVCNIFIPGTRRPKTTTLHGNFRDLVRGNSLESLHAAGLTSLQASLICGLLPDPNPTPGPAATPSVIINATATDV